MERVGKILITGGAGFLGSKLVHSLLKTTHAHICVIDDLSRGKVKFLPKNNRVQFFQRSILDEEELEKIFKRFLPDVVYHLAAKCFLPACAESPKETLLSNVVGTEILLRMCNKYKINHFIFASSCAVYDKSKRALRESDKTEPLEIYGISKLMSESLIKNYSTIAWTICRLFTVFGENPTEKYLIPTVIEQLARKKVLSLGNLSTKRDYIYVEDVVRAFVKIMNNKKAFFEIVNIGTGKSYSGNAVVRLIAKKMNKHVQKKVDKMKLRQNDNPIILASVTKIKRLIGWKPRYTFGDGITKLINHTV